MCMLNSRGPTCLNRLHHIGAGTHRVPHIDAASHARVHIADRLQNIERRMPQLIFRPVVVDGEAYVVLLHKLLDARKSTGRWVSSDNHRDTRALAILEFTADVVIFILREIDRSRRVQLNAGRMVVVERFRLLRRIHRADDL